MPHDRIGGNSVSGRVPPIGDKRKLSSGEGGTGACVSSGMMLGPSTTSPMASGYASLLTKRRNGSRSPDPSPNLFANVRNASRRLISPLWIVTFASICLVVSGLLVWHTLLRTPPMIWRVPDVCGYKSILYDTNVTQRIPPGNYFIAANVHDNEKTLPHLLHQLKRVVDIIGDPSRVYVSIFESGSTDLSKEWLYMFADVLDAKNVSNSIVTSDLRRLLHEHRIDFLARVRNKALEPLFQSKQSGFKADYVLFVNDVFMCAEDLIRLAQRVSLPETDMACGMDFEFDPDHSYSTEITFYDTWVALDLAGNFLSSMYPFFGRTHDRDRLLRSEPVPVFCCWNGMIAVKAAPFYEGIRFRSESSGCRASECTLFCKDMWNAGHGNILIDPTVAVAYDHAASGHLAVSPARGIGTFKGDPFAPVKFTEGKPSDFMCHGLSGSGRHPNMVKKRVKTF
ncbi:unnamed protein product (mitochondrion) [Plasmodiophora brassicae]|uniref:Uncharacterized protein n=1 Tax=Plasmodiophora brassicae TaxID=37360 RepID=A0A0G4ILA6_PLABS|nr:hypothetical protein PBRA_004598 [Plasmodiophora brassicae]SPR00171.1 unnamed protein product [Plasmodiophora brassicae]